MKKALFFFAMAMACSAGFVFGQNPTCITPPNPISAITATTATVSGTVVNPVIGDTMLVWASMTGGSYHSDTLVITTTQPMPVAIAVSGLTPLTQYSQVKIHAKLLQTGTVGVSTAPYGAFTTLAFETSPQITFPQGPVVEPYSIRVRFHYNFGCPTLTQTRLQWGTTPALGTYAPDLFLSGAGDTAITISGLTPNSTVYYRIETISSCAVSASTVVSASTSVVPAPVGVCGQALVTYNSAKIPFSVQPGSQFMGSTITKVRFSAVSAGVTYTDSIVGSFTNALLDTFMISGLAGNTGVTYTLKFFNSAGSSSTCSGSCVTAPYPAPPTVSLGQATGISSCNAHVPVTVTAPVAGSVVRLFWKHVSQNTYDTLQSVLVCNPCTTGSYVITVSPLLQETSYHVRTEQYVIPQNKGYSNTLGITTLNGESPSIQVIGGIMPTSNGFLIPIEGSGNGYIATASAKVRTLDGALVASPSLVVGSCFFHDTLVVQGLASCTPYEIDVEIESVGGNSADPELAHTGCASITELSDAAIAVYPNPVITTVTIGGIDEPFTVSFINTAGQVILHQTCFGLTSIDVSLLPGGMYTALVQSKEQRTQKRILKL